MISDGAPNCSVTDAGTCVGPGDCPLLESADDELRLVVAEALADEAIRTHVLGIQVADALLGTDPADALPEANPFVRLNEIAVAGGAPLAGAERFYNADDEAELLSALDAILVGQLVCQVDLTVPPNEPPSPAHVDRDNVRFTVAGIDQPRLDGADEATCRAGDLDGWIWLDPGRELLLCGAPCEAAKRAGEFDGLYECPSL